MITIAAPAAAASRRVMLIAELAKLELRSMELETRNEFVTDPFERSELRAEDMPLQQLIHFVRRELR
jgi:hypothetical protein